MCSPPCCGSPVVHLVLGSPSSAFLVAPGLPLLEAVKLKGDVVSFVSACWATRTKRLVVEVLRNQRLRFVAPHVAQTFQHKLLQFGRLCQGHAILVQPKFFIGRSASGEVACCPAITIGRHHAQRPAQRGRALLLRIGGRGQVKKIFQRRGIAPICQCVDRSVSDSRVVPVGSDLHPI